MGITVGELFWIKTLLGLNLVLLIGVLLSILGYLNKFKVKININSISKWKSAEFAPTVLLAIDNAYKIISINKSGEKLFRQHENTLIKTSFFQYLEKSEIEKFIEDVSNTSKYLKPNENKIYNLKIKNSINFVPVKIIISVWEEEAELYFTLIIENIENTLKGRQEIINKINLYKTGEEISNYGTWEWDLETDVVIASENAMRIWGMEDLDAINFDSFSKRVYFKDVEVYLENIKDGIKNKKDFISEFRILSLNGEIIKLRNNIKIVYNEGKEIIKLIGTTTKL